MNVTNPNQPTSEATQQSVEVLETPAAREVIRDDVPASALEQTDEKTWAMVAHLSALAGYLIPFANIVVPLVIWQKNKDQSPFVADQAKEAANFQITFIIFLCMAALIMVVLMSLGVALLFGLAVVDIVFIIMAALSASKGNQYRYPLSIQYIK